MSAIKGYPDKAKTDAGTGHDFVTVNPVRESQVGLDVIAHAFTQLIGADAAEAASTTRIITATAHAALVGDIISWTSGTLNTREYRVSAADTNTITVSVPMYVAPTAADTFNILRQKAAVVTAAGGISTAISNDTNYGAVGANTLRTGAQIGNATGAADFNLGTPGAQTLRSAAMLGVGSTAVSNANPVPISDAGGSLTVDGAVAATQSGTWNVGTVTTVTAVTAITNGITVSTQAAQTASTAVFQAEGAIAFGSLTNSYATLFTPSAATKMLQMRNNCNAAVSVSMDAGSTTHYTLDAGDAISLDLQANALNMGATAIQVKYAVGAPTSGSFRINGAH